jgi:peptidyl-prolyl cis-trans isomerase A (cyclophilin A)
MSYLFDRMTRLLAAGAVALFAAAATAQDKGTAAPRVVLATSLGEITLQLDAEKAPKTVANFLEYVKSGHYDGTIFHRVIDGFMIQGGGFTPEMAQKPTRAPIPLESRSGLKNERGTVAMARTAVADSATSQFFINVADNAMLDQPNARDGQGYAVFGKVVAGMDVVDRIRKVETGNQKGHQNVPSTPVLIRSATIAK